MGAKIRRAQLEKTPLMVILGKREIESNQVAVRSRAKGDEGSIDTETFLKQLQSRIANREEQA